MMFPHTLKEAHIERSLYPAAQPRQEGHLKVSELHTLFYAVYGNPKGIPVVVLHGGPGVGFNETFHRFFDPARWNVVMFDQRGAMRSKPFGSMEENTSQNLVEDIEVLRNHFGIDKWVVFGGSWGSTLGLLYGEAYPERCLGFILRGIFLGRKQDIQHVIYGMGKVFPEAYDQLLSHFSEEDRKDLLEACYRKVINPDPAVHLPIARAFMRFDLICSTHLPNLAYVEKALQNDSLVLSTARAFCYYAMHDFFLEPDQILSRVERIAHLPAILIHGRWDAIDLPEGAYALYKKWDKSQLWIMTQGGHASNDPAMGPALVEATDLFALGLVKE